MQILQQFSLVAWQKSRPNIAQSRGKGCLAGLTATLVLAVVFVFPAAMATGTGNLVPADNGSSPSTQACSPAVCLTEHGKGVWEAKHKCTFCAVTVQELAVAAPKASTATLQAVADILNGHLIDYGLDTPGRLRQFFAQAGAETGGSLSPDSESLNYSAYALLVGDFKYFRNHKKESCKYGRIEAGTSAYSKGVAYCKKILGVKNVVQHKADQESIANRAYAKRYGNGDIKSGDGWKYRGRGIFQVTFHDNYEANQDWYNKNIRATNEPKVDFLSSPNLLTTSKWGVVSAAVYWKRHGLDAKVPPGSAPSGKGWKAKVCGVANSITDVINKHTSSRSDRCLAAERLVTAGAFSQVDCSVPPSKKQTLPGVP